MKSRKALPDHPQSSRSCAASSVPPNAAITSSLLRSASSTRTSPAGTWSWVGSSSSRGNVWAEMSRSRSAGSVASTASAGDSSSGAGVAVGRGSAVGVTVARAFGSAADSGAAVWRPRRSHQGLGGRRGCGRRDDQPAHGVAKDPAHGRDGRDQHHGDGDPAESSPLAALPARQEWRRGGRSRRVGLSAGVICRFARRRIKTPSDPRRLWRSRRLEWVRRSRPGRSWFHARR